jgi:hypothetical protein
MGRRDRAVDTRAGRDVAPGTDGLGAPTGSSVVQTDQAVARRRSAPRSAAQRRGGHTGSPTALGTHETVPSAAATTLPPTVPMAAVGEPSFTAAPLATASETSPSPSPPAPSATTAIAAPATTAAARPRTKARLGLAPPVPSAQTPPPVTGARPDDPLGRQ